MSYDLWEVPDAIEPMVGYRGWLADHGKLWSVYPDIRSVEWPVDEPLEAQCLPPLTRANVDSPHPLQTPPEHDRPILECTCGIYALHEFPTSWVEFEGKRRQASKPWPVDAVVGVVEGWGHIVVGSKGWRAQFARPIALVSRHRSKKWAPIVEELAEAYKLDIVDTRDLRLGAYPREHK